MQVVKKKKKDKTGKQNNVLLLKYSYACKRALIFVYV